MESIVQGTIDTKFTHTLIKKAYANISFDADSRATREIEAFRTSILDTYTELKETANGENIDTLTEMFNRFIDGYTTRNIARINALSNCYSVMITGGANFNNARHRKVTNIERERSEEQRSYYEHMVKKMKKALSPAPKSTREQLEEAVIHHEQALLFNKLQRRKISREEKLKAALEISKDTKVLKGFIWNLDNNSKFFTVNSNERVKRLKEKLKKEATLSGLENKIKSYNGFSVVSNYKIERYQIFFENIPEVDTRSVLKSLGFRWSHKAKAWQTNLTDNGRRKLISFINFSKPLGK